MWPRHLRPVDPSGIPDGVFEAGGAVDVEAGGEGLRLGDATGEGAGGGVGGVKREHSSE
jgi:hypothetical protein